MDSENEENSLPSSLLSLEIKELRNKIISLKKSVTKGDKKQKKAIQDELTALESLLAAKQEDLQRMKETATKESNEEVSNEKVINKMRLKKERRRDEKEAEWEANRQAALAEIASRPDFALEESKAFNHRLSQKGFRILEVSADGHCMFSAIGCQLDPPRDHWELRKMAAKYLRENEGEFENFIDFEDEKICAYNCNNFQFYCDKIESTGMWGGQMELEALSRALGITIVVIQAEGLELKFNENENETENNSDILRERIYLSFHKFAFSLGEHYNALLPY